MGEERRRGAQEADGGEKAPDIEADRAGWNLMGLMYVCSDEGYTGQGDDEGGEGRDASYLPQMRPLNCLSRFWLARYL